MCKEGKCLECVTIDRNQLSDYLDKIARFLIGTGKVKTDDMMQEEIFDYVVEVVTVLSSDLADAKSRAAAAEKGWHANEARVTILSERMEEYEHLESIADGVNDWLVKSGLGGTGHQISLNGVLSAIKSMNEQYKSQ